jgi:hypothetical protein
MATCGIAPEDDDGNAAVRPVKQSPAPNLQPPAMNDKEFALCVESMGMCTDLEGLKGIFGGAYKRCDAQHKEALTNEYNHNKTRLEKAA